MIRAAFFDIDGTLLPHSTGRVPASAEQAERDLREKGIKVFAATGRHMLELEELPLDGLCFDGYILLNGQICSDGAGNLLYAVPVPAGDTASLASLFEKCEVPVMFIEEKRMYMNFVNDRVRRVQADILTAVPEISVYSGVPVYQCVVYVDETESRDLPRILRFDRALELQDRQGTVICFFFRACSISSKRERHCSSSVVVILMARWAAATLK